jgi:methylmalonyl-CoA mutase cobalamin-binding subunit
MSIKARRRGTKGAFGKAKLGVYLAQGMRDQLRRHGANAIMQLGLTGVVSEPTAQALEALAPGSASKLVEMLDDEGLMPVESVS